MTCTLVVVIHDSAPDLERLLASLHRHAPDPDRQLVVVDSGSSDPAGLSLARAAGAETLELPGNPGFGAANNAGIARARHPVTVLLNPDVELLDGRALSGLIARADERDALHAPRLLNSDGTVQRSAHPVPGGWDALLPAIVHPSVLPGRLRTHADPWRAGEEREVGWAIAAVLAARTGTLRRLGPFDPAIHLYAEDLDLGLRARPPASRPSTTRNSCCAMRVARPRPRRSVASPSSCSPSAAARSSRHGSAAAPDGATTRPRRSRSPRGSRAASHCAATRPASGRSSPLCGPRGAPVAADASERRFRQPRGGTPRRRRRGGARETNEIRTLVRSAQNNPS